MPIRRLNAVRLCMKVAKNVHRFTHCMLAGHFSRSNKATNSFLLKAIVERNWAKTRLETASNCGLGKATRQYIRLQLGSPWNSMALN